MAQVNVKAETELDKATVTVTCPVCDEELDIDTADGALEEGDTLMCDACDTPLVVTSVEPLEVAEDEDADELDGDGEDEDEDEDDDDCDGDSGDEDDEDEDDED